MEHKVDIQRCKIAKHRIELEPEAFPLKEKARRMSPEKAAGANQEVQNLLAPSQIQPSYSLWASGIVMVKTKTSEVRFCYDFRPLNNVTVKDAIPLPRIDDSLSRIGTAEILTCIDVPWAFWQIPLEKNNRRKTVFACELGLSNGDAYFRGMQCIRNIPTIHHQSFANNQTATRASRHGVH